MKMNAESWNEIAAGAIWRVTRRAARCQRNKNEMVAIEHARARSNALTRGVNAVKMKCWVFW
jgi:hypothetical protein